MTRVFQFLSPLIVLAALASGGSADDTTLLKCKYNQAIVLLKGKAFLHEVSIEESMRIILTNTDNKKTKARITIFGGQWCQELMGIADEFNINAWCERVDDGVKGTHSIIIDRVTSVIQKQLSIDDSPAIMYGGTCLVSNNLF